MSGAGGGGAGGGGGQYRMTPERTGIWGIETLQLSVITCDYYLSGSPLRR